MSAITGKHVSRVYRWMYPKEKGGTGGYVPQEDAAKLLKAAPVRGVPLKPADFFEVSDPASAEVAA